MSPLCSILIFIIISSLQLVAAGSPCVGPSASRHSPPTFVELPSAHYVGTSTTEVILNCRASGSPYPSLYWMKNGKNLTSYRSISIIPSCDNGIVGKSLAMTRVWRNDADISNVGDYQCVAKNKYGTKISKVAPVYIKYIKQFETNPLDAASAVGKTATIECDPPEGIPKPKVQWFFQPSEGAKRNPATENRRAKVISDNLRIENIQTDDKGFYTCEASNLAGTVTSIAAQLTVQEPPRFTYRPTDQTVVAGSKVVFACRAKGIPRPWILWSKGADNINSGERYEITQNEMIIKSARVTDSGSYTCHAKNNAGTETYRLHLQVNDQPGPVLTRMDVDEGDDVTLDCKIGSGAAATDSPIAWSITRGLVLVNFQHPYNPRFRVGSDGKLLIRAVTPDDAGEYKCLGGDDEKQSGVTLHVAVSSYPVPPLVTRAPSNRSVLLGETVTFHCPFLSRSDDARVRWLSDGEEMKSGVDGARRIVSTEGSSGILRIYQILPSDQAKYTCVVLDKNGKTSSSAFLTVMALGVEPPNNNPLDVAPEAPGLPHLIASSTDSLTIKWTAPGNEHTNDKEFFYELSYYQMGQELREWTILSKVDSTTFTVSGLQPSNGCFFSVRAFNRFGSSEAVITSAPFYTQDQPSTARSFDVEKRKLLETVLLDRLQVSTIQMSGKRRLQLAWEVSENLCEIAKGYQIMARPLTNVQADVILSATSCNQRTYDLDVLVDEEFEVQILPFDDNLIAYNGLLATVSADRKVVTAQPPVIARTTLTDDQSGVEVAWNHPHILHVIDDYVVTCQTANFRQVVYVGARSGQTHATCTRLPADVTRVNVTVAYVTPLGAGPKVETVFSLVDPALPPVPSIVVEDTDTKSLATPGTTVTLGTGNDFLSSPTGMAVIAITSLVIILVIVGVTCYIRRRRNPKFRDRAGRHLDRYNQPMNYGQNFDLTVMDRNSRPPPPPSAQMGGAGDGNYAKMSEQRRTSSAGGNVYVSPGLPPPSHSFTNGKLPMTSYQSGRCSASDSPLQQQQQQQQQQPSLGGGGGFSYVNDQLISVTSIPPQFTAANQQNMSHGNQQADMDTAQHYQDLQQHHLPAVMQDPPSPPLSQKTRASDLSMSSGSMMHSNGGRSSSSGQRRRRSLRNNALPPAGPPRQSAVVPHSNYTNSNNAPVGVATIDAAAQKSYHNDRLYVNYTNRNLTAARAAEDPRQSMAVSGVSMMTACGSADDVEDDDCYQSSGEESFDMPSASQVGTSLNNHEYQHGVNLPHNNSSSRPHHHQEYLPTLDEVTGHGRRDTDPLLGRGSQSSEVMSATRNHHQQHHQRHQQQQQARDQASASSSVTSSYHHHTGDSGMSAGVASTEQSSLRSDVGLPPPPYATAPTSSSPGEVPHQQPPPQQHMPAFIDEKFMGTISPPPSAISMQSGYNSTASSCWQYQPSLQQQLQQQHHHHRPPAIKPKSWRQNMTEEAAPAPGKNEIDVDCQDFPDPPEMEIDDSNVATPIYRQGNNNQYEDGMKYHHHHNNHHNHHHHNNTTPISGVEPVINDKQRFATTDAAEVSTSDFYSDQSQ